LVVDSIISGETSQEINSRVAALGWRADGQVAVLLGTRLDSPDPDQIRKIARKSDGDVLIGIQGRRQVVVIGLLTHSENPNQRILDIANSLKDLFGLGDLMLGPTVAAVSDSARSAKAALAALSVAASRENLSRPTLADDLLPERMLAGDQLAKLALINRYYLPLVSGSQDLLSTLRSYLEHGGSLEATAKSLFVHANTVRYRLRRIQDLIGEDVTDARIAFVIQTAIVVGLISDTESGVRR
jgi:sugar diacid utilization regulator